MVINSNIFCQALWVPVSGYNFKLLKKPVMNVYSLIDLKWNFSEIATQLTDEASGKNALFQLVFLRVIFNKVRN